MDEWVCRSLANSLSISREKHNYDIWAWVFMPEHVHILINPREIKYSVSSILKSIKHPVSLKVIFKYQREMSTNLNLMSTGLSKPKYRLWQPGGGHDRNIYKSVELVELVDYIHNNPVKRGLVDKPEDWKWSSAREWLTEGTCPVSIDKSSFPPT